MNANKFRMIGDMSMALALAAAVVGALSVMSLDSMAFAKDGSDDGGSSSSSDDHGGSSSHDDSDDDSNDDDHDDDHGGRGSDDDDDHDDDHGGKNGGDDSRDIVLGDGVVLPEDLAAAVASLEGAGFQVLTIKREDRGVVEAKVVDATGTMLEIYYDPATSTVLSQKLED